MQTFTGKQYLQIDIANNFGLDKKPFADRLSWFNENEHQLHGLLNQASEPALFYAGVKAWESVKAGEPIGYPISLDATSSGLQILACLTGDRKAAEICNVVNAGIRADAYTIVYQNMLDVIGEEAKIKREDAKTAVMTAFYGSKAEPKRVFGEGKLLYTFYDTMKLLAPGAWELNEEFLAIWGIPTGATAFPKFERMRCSTAKSAL